ncbi:MAG: hypothetical protein HMLKMBBP_03527 [Planctomycetes bacterium]|nr:hypothetical protein [Planctomycetota bacterium]
MATSILTSGQQRLHRVVLVLSVFLLANAAYLWACPPAERSLGVFYQWMLVSHVVVGTLLLLPMSWFVVWHLRRALAMRNPRAVWTGVAITAAAYALFVTGLFIFNQANSADNRWAFLSHRTLAVVAPLAYVIHRVLSRHAPDPRWVKIGVAAPVILFGAMFAADRATAPAPRPVGQAFVQKPKEGEDPFRNSFPDYGVSGAPRESEFFPAATRSGSGKFLPQALLTNDDLATTELLTEEIRTYGFAVSAKIGSETCARCHQDIVDQWSKSAHRYSSFNNPFYRVAVEDLRAEDDGKTRSQWCAGCHDPAIMMAGNWKKDIRPETPESQAGLTCLACHLMDEVHGVGGNGNYKIDDVAPSPYLFNQAKSGPLAEAHDLLVKSKPDVHKADMLKPVFRTSEFCGTCHKVSLDTPVNRYRWLRGQNEYDNHQDSGVSRNNARTFYLPPVAKNCQDCHMPYVPAPKGDVSAKNGMVRSHLFPGPNTALPHIRGDQETVKAMEAFLQDQKMRVDVFAVRQGDRTHAAPAMRPVTLAAGEDAEFHVVVRNLGVGHTFPGGTLDSNESWIRFEIADAADPSKPLWRSGEIDPKTLVVDQDAHFYRVVFVNERSEEAHRRNPQDFRAPVHAKVIGPGTADVVRYGVAIPRELAGRRVVVTASLMWRKFRQNYTEYAWKKTVGKDGRPLPVLPVTTIASGKAEFAVAASAQEPGALPADAFTKDNGWQRWNDWGIALLLQGDTRGALAAFGAVRDAEPTRADGWRNLARTKLADGEAKAALDLLAEADKRKPGDPQTAYFLGQALEQLGQLDEAVAQFERSAQTFGGDRTIHQSIGRIRFRQERWEEALASFLRVLAIDPEDRIAHQHRMLIYRGKAADAADPAQRKDLEHAADMAEKAFRKFSVDEAAQKWTNEFRRARPDVNFESLPVHVHRLEHIR